MKKNKKEGIEALKEQVKIQCLNGNWNYDSYMHGMANGLICALATVEGKEPKYLEKPNTWLCNNQKISVPKESTFEPNKFLVVNRKYLNDIPTWKCGLVAWALQCIENHVPENYYYVCNQDEPYAHKVIATILAGELAKEEESD